jgi:hypothetical protein
MPQCKTLGMVCVEGAKGVDDGACVGAWGWARCWDGWGQGSDFGVGACAASVPLCPAAWATVSAAA